ncbi:MAG: potassium channel family protein [Polaribacter sp.]|jgi:voltage-gated potassium channel|nr:potassium channel family protein [Polaribacter sp.]MDG2073674.1 potassium channel family protein [Polaribacter sp.]
MIFFKTIIAYFQDKQYRDLLLTTIIIIGFGSTIYHYLEGWSWVDSIYFSVITLTTIGFGDFAPSTPGGKIFTIFYIVIGIGVILSFVNTVYNHYNTTKKKKKKK